MDYERAIIAKILLSSYDVPALVPNTLHSQPHKRSVMIAPIMQVKEQKSCMPKATKGQSRDLAPGLTF